MERTLYPPQPARVIKTRPSDCVQSYFLTNLLLNLYNEYDKIYIYSPSLHQDFYQNLNKCFTKYIPFHIIPNNLNEEVIDVINDEIVNNKAFQKSDTEIETYESIEN